MMQVYSLKEIQKKLNLETDIKDLIRSQQQAFIAYSQGEIDLPPPMHLSFPNAHGDCHIKSGCKIGDEYFVIKIATGFYNNYSQGLPAGDGAILIFSQHNGLLAAILLDEGYLTTLRSALAACVAAQLTPFAINNIGIVGTGNLAVLCLQMMGLLYPKAQFKLWGRNNDKAQKLITDSGQNTTFATIPELLDTCDLVITTSASKQAIVLAEHIHKKIHIIGLGADEPGKQEIEPDVFKQADLVLVDNIKQAIRYGDTAQAIDAGVINQANLQELGNILANETKLSNAQLLITSLTGIAAQDIAIANFVLKSITPTVK